MRIEDLTKGKLETLNEQELINLRDRANQVFKKILQNEDEILIKPTIISKYFLLIDEMIKRNMQLNWTSPLDKIRFKSKMLGIDYTQLDEIMIEEGFVNAVGEYKKGEPIEVMIKTKNNKIRKELTKELKKQKINLKLVNGLDESRHVETPIFDLVLKPNKNPSKKILDPKPDSPYNRMDEEIDLFNVPITAKKRKQQDFTKVDTDEGIVGAVVYRASNKDDPWTDADEEWTDRETLEKAAYDYMCKSQTIFHMHNPLDGKMPAYVIESFITDEDTIKKISDGSDYKIPANSWWLAVKIDKNTDEGKELWDKVKSGKLTGFSFGGVGFSENKSPDEE